MDMVTIRPYRSEDAGRVGQLIADTYSAFNLFWVPAERLPLFLGPFQYARSPDPAHREAIARILEADVMLVAEDDGEIVGVLRGRKDKLQSLFVRGDHHRRGIGRRLVEEFERTCRGMGTEEIKVQATLYAVPFYLSLGFKRTTGVRAMRSFQGEGLPYQPMKKALGE